MFELINNLMKNMACSNCSSSEFDESYIKENYTSWNLYLKKYELFSAMILYNEKLDKDISYVINKNDSIFLLDSNKEIFIKLEYISNNEEDNISILVPTDEYQELYEKIEHMEKSFDKKINAHYIGTFDIKKCK